MCPDDVMAAVLALEAKFCGFESHSGYQNIMTKYTGRWTGYVVKCDLLNLEVRVAEGVRGFNVPVTITEEVLDEVVEYHVERDPGSFLTVLEVIRN